MHERTLLGVTNEEGSRLGWGMPTGLVGSYLDGVCRSPRRDKWRYGFLVVAGAMYCLEQVCTESLAGTKKLAIVCEIYKL